MFTLYGLPRLPTRPQKFVELSGLLRADNVKQTWQPMQQFAHFCEAGGCYVARPQAMIIGQSLSSRALFLSASASVRPIHMAPSLLIVFVSTMNELL